MPDALRAETVGSLLRTEEIVRAARGDNSPDAGKLLDEAVIDAVRLQQDIGLDVITDGEMRRASWAQTPRFVDCFENTPGRGALNWRGGTGRPAAPAGTGAPAFGYPAVVRRVAGGPRTGSMAGEYAFLARHARARTKFTMPAPSYHRRYWSDEHSTRAYRDCAEFLTDIRDYQREVVRDLVALGCDYIQLDAPNYGSLCDPDNRARMTAEGRDPEAEIIFDAELDSSLFEGVDNVTTALHICRGNGPGGAWHSAGGYGAISGVLFPRLNFRRLLLEYDSDRAGGFEPLADVRPGTVVVLTNPALRANTQHDANQFIADAANGTLPAVSFLKPGDDDGHPGYSTLAGFENFTARAIAAVQDNPRLWKSTAIFGTFDETGGYYDSGYIQPLSFFGDGPRVPMLVVSPFARRGFVDHTYTDHVSLLKFIEANWRLGPLTSFSEDNLPNPTPGAYVPRDRPAIGNLMTLFDFDRADFQAVRLGVRSEPAGAARPNVSYRLR
jgi:methionine synthase II (cobalamin-independent)